MTNRNTNALDAYFKSLGHAYAYALMESKSGLTCSDILRITVLCYRFKNIAYKWYVNIKEELVKLDNVDIMNQSLLLLNERYTSMIEDYDDEDEEDMFEYVEYDDTEQTWHIISPD